METDFLSSWNKILLFRDICSVCEYREIQFLKKPYSCWWKLIFWLVETIFFLPFWETPPTANFIFPSSGSVFLNAFLLVERDFQTSGNTFYFSDISQVNYADTRHICQFFSRLVERYFWNESLILASGNGFSG